MRKKTTARLCYWIDKPRLLAMGYSDDDVEDYSRDLWDTLEAAARHEWPGMEVRVKVGGGDRVYGASVSEWADTHGRPPAHSVEREADKIADERLRLLRGGQ